MKGAFIDLVKGIGYAAFGIAVFVLILYIYTGIGWLAEFPLRWLGLPIW